MYSRYSPNLKNKLSVDNQSAHGLAFKRFHGSNLRYKIGPKTSGDDQSARGLGIQRSRGSNLRYRIGPKTSGDDQSARGLGIQRSRGSILRYRIGPKTSGDDQSARGLVIQRFRGSILRYRIGPKTSGDDQSARGLVIKRRRKVFRVTEMDYLPPSKQSRSHQRICCQILWSIRIPSDRKNSEKAPSTSVNGAHRNEVRVVGLEPTRLATPDPKSGLSTNFSIPALECR